MKNFAYLLFWVFCAATPASAQDASSRWIASARSMARLIAAGPLEGGLYSAGIEVKLFPNTITYWRMPGEAGVPPSTNFDGSENLAQAELLFPAPMRIAEAGGVEAFGYQAAVLFPLHVTPRDPQKPVHLVLSFNYAACEKICVPASANVHMDLNPQAPLSPYAAAIARAQATIPRLASADAVITAAPQSNKPMWTVAFAGAQDMFAEGPEGWYFTTASGSPAGVFLLTLTDWPKGAALTQIPLRLTVLADKGPFELTTKLDAATPKP